MSKNLGRKFLNQVLTWDPLLIYWKLNSSDRQDRFQPPTQLTQANGTLFHLPRTSVSEFRFPQVFPFPFQLTTILGLLISLFPGTVSSRAWKHWRVCRIPILPKCWPYVPKMSPFVCSRSTRPTETWLNSSRPITNRQKNPQTLPAVLGVPWPIPMARPMGSILWNVGSGPPREEMRAKPRPVMRVTTVNWFRMKTARTRTRIEEA